jgi:MFS family permease
VVLVGAVLTLARFSEAFLVLRASGVGLTAALVPLVMVAMNVVYAASAYPAGVLADRLDRRTLLAAGLAALIAADIVLALGASVAQVMVGVALWGLHMGLTQGLLATLVADASPPHLRGSAFGVSNLVSGLVLLAASALAGALWEFFGAPAAFLAGAGFTTVALLSVLIMRQCRRALDAPARSNGPTG